jgi:hypothetical protein
VGRPLPYAISGVAATTPFGPRCGVRRGESACGEKLAARMALPSRPRFFGKLSEGAQPCFTDTCTGAVRRT